MSVSKYADNGVKFGAKMACPVSNGVNERRENGARWVWVKKARIIYTILVHPHICHTPLRRKNKIIKIEFEYIINNK